MEENINIFALVLDELNKNDMWFTTKADPTAEEASSYYKLDEYGEPTEATVKKIEKEVTSLIGDGAVDIYDAVELWVNDALVAFRIDYKDNLVTQFEDKPVVDNIEAYENPVQFPQSKKTESFDVLSYEVEYELKDGTTGKIRINGVSNAQDMKETLIRTLNDMGYYKTPSQTLKTYSYKLVDRNTLGEAKTKKTEGAGAGYHISGTINVNNINSFKVINQEEPDKYGDIKATIECDIDVTLSEMSASSYYYGNDINVDVPAKVTGLVVAISSDDEPNDIGVDEGSIKVLLDGTKFKTLIGGGWTHTTFTGDIQATDRDIADKEYYFSYFTEIDIQIPDENIVKYIDKVVEGENFFTEFLVYDQDGDIISDEFTAEETDYSAVDKAQDDAIEFAKANKGVRVVKQTYRELADGDLDNYDTEPEVVWEREYNKNYKFDDEVEESKEVKTETYKPTEDEKVGKMKDTNGTFFDVYQHGDKFLDVLGNELSKEEVAEYVKKYNKIESVDNAERKKKQIEAFKNRKVNFNKRTKDKKFEAIEDNFYSAFDSHGFRRKINKDTTIEELMNELYNFITFENISKDDTRKAIKDIVSHLNMQLNADLDALSMYLWYINGNYGGTYEKVRKNKITENYQRRLDEVNNKSKNLISDLFSSNDFDSDSPAGQIVMRTSEMFNALSDKGYDVEVTFDNGESTSAIQLGQQGGKVMITITNTDQPLRAFTSGNFEINDQNIKILQDIQSQIEVL